MTPDAAMLAVIAELRQRIGVLDGEVAVRDAEIAALRQHLADHPANQEAADAG